MKRITLVPAVGAASVSLMLAASFLDFMVGIPMVGSVALTGESSVSWAGEARIFASLSLMVISVILATWQTNFGGMRAGWLVGISTGWLAAFVFGALDWYLQQQMLLSAMNMESAGSDVEVGPGAVCFAVSIFFWLTFAVAQIWRERLA